MDAPYRMAEFASLIAEPRRARIVTALMGGIALPAGELALQSGVTASTASEHLAVLVSGGLLSVERQGRHRYYRISNSNMASALESWASMLPPSPKPKYRSAERARLALARTCYDHLAGELGVGLTEALLTREILLDKGLQYELDPRQLTLLRAMGLELNDCRRADSAPLGRKCLDCTERRYHVGGALGALFAQEIFRLAWVRRIPGARALRVLPQGRHALRKHFGLSF